MYESCIVELVGPASGVMSIEVKIKLIVHLTAFSLQSYWNISCMWWNGPEWLYDHTRQNPVAMIVCFDKLLL